MKVGLSVLLKVILPISISLMGLLLGLLFQKLVMTRIAEAARKTKWKIDDIVVQSLRGMFPLWFFLGACWIALKVSLLNPTLVTIIEKTILVVLILSATWFVANVSGGLIQMYASTIKELVPPSSIFRNLTKAVIFALGILIVLQTLGISITPLLTALGVGGLAVALALQDTLSNLFAGLHIIISKQVRVGDFVKLETGEEGYVTDITWRNTTIRMLPNNIIVIPNNKLASSIVTNYHLPQKELAVLVQVGVSYDSDLEKVEKVTIEVAKEVMRTVEGGIPEFEPFIRYHSFSDFSIDFTVIMRAKEFVDHYKVKHEFIKRLHKRYKQEGIEIPFPIRTVYLKGHEEEG